MRAGILLATVLLWALPLSLHAQVEIVGGFRGYPWGTPASAIPEIAGTQPVGQKDSLAIYSAQVTVAGAQALAGFYFHPVNGGLVEGAYVFALTLQSCLPVWYTLVESIQSDYPRLAREARVPVRAERDLLVYDTDCEYYAFNSHIETWTATYANPSPPHDRVLLSMRTIERMPRLTVLYRGGAGQAWADRPRPTGRSHR